LEARIFKIITSFAVGNMGKKKGLSDVDRSKIVTLHEERCAENQTFEKLKFSNSAIHQ